jgi:hypothetical protein
VLLIPRVSTLFARVLEEAGVRGDAALAPYALQLLPLADDVLSLEADDAFRAIWAVGASSSRARRAA